MDETFSLGLTYWPRRTAFGWWRAFDRGEAREELAHVAALGCDTVRFCLRWEDFQPGPRRINGAALLLYEDRYHTNKANDLYTDPKVLDAQRYLIREVAGYFGPHPALSAWQ